MVNLPRQLVALKIHKGAVIRLGGLVKYRQHAADRLLGGNRRLLTAHVGLHPSGVDGDDDKVLGRELARRRAAQHVLGRLGHAVRHIATGGRVFD